MQERTFILNKAQTSRKGTETCRVYVRSVSEVILSTQAFDLKCSRLTSAAQHRHHHHQHHPDMVTKMQ